jgi:hypothetical protein
MAHRYPFSIIYPNAFYGQLVAVYYNLHYHVFSLKQGGKSGLLLSHAQTCELTNAVFDVEPKGRERAIKQGRKNVHAYVVGVLQVLSWDKLSDNDLYSLFNMGYQKVTYNLHPNHPQFYYKEASSYTPVLSAQSVILTGNIALALN